MIYFEIKQDLARNDLKPGDMFPILGRITSQVNDKSTHNEGRDLVIRALARRDICDEFETKVLASLVRSVGLYPYLSPMLDAVDDEDYLAYELHRPDGLEAVFHSLQARIYQQLRAGSNVVLSASTSVGKSLLIDAMIALGKFRKVVIVLPTLALIDETRKRLAQKFRDRCHFITHPTQVAVDGKLNVYILTQERVRHRIDLSNVDFFVVDEFYKIDLRLDGDKQKQRAIELNLAFHQLAATRAQFYLLGPNVQAIKGLDRYEFHFIPSDYSTVAVDVQQFNLPRAGDDRPNKLVELASSLEGPTLIYCQAPGSAVKVAGRLIRNVVKAASKECIDIAEWMSENYHPEWAAVDAIRHGVGLHHGGIPRALQQHMVRMFNGGQVKFLVCTSTLIEGVNTSAENVIVYDRRKNKGVLDFFTYRNIQGRAGRMGKYFVGKVFMLEKAPEDDEVVVEYPIGEQNSETPLSLLIQLEEDALSDLSRSRVDEFVEQSILSRETLRLNGSVSPEIQNEVAKYVRQLLLDGDQTLLWRGFPGWERLVAACDILVKYISGARLKNFGIGSGPQLAWHVSRVSQPAGLKGYLQDIANGIRPHQSISDKIDEGLRIVRNVVTFQFPSDLMVLSRIVSELAGNLELPLPDYGPYAEAAEHLFVPPAIAALEEYGIPIQLAKKVSNYLDPNDLDETIGLLRIMNVDDVPELTPFERSFIRLVQESV